MGPTRQAALLDEAALAQWPLPDHGTDADKEARGQVLVVASSNETPGACLLASVAALRAGAGKLLIAAPEGIASGLALAVPEARVITLPQSRSGAFIVSPSGALRGAAEHVRAVVIGPGMMDEALAADLVGRLLPIFRHGTVVLDALAMSVVLDGPLEQPVIMTPHAGEMAFLSGQSKEAICKNPPLGFAAAAAELWNACVALKGATTCIAEPGGATWRSSGGTPGLATSGSGDVLAGVIGGLAARGMAPTGAAAWGVVLHARAGQALARRRGTLGFLARELAGEIPALIHAASRRRGTPGHGN